MSNKHEDDIVKFNRIIGVIKEDTNKGTEIFFNEYAKLIKQFVYKLTRDEFVVNEILNDILIKVWLIAEKLDYIKNPFSWLCVVTKNRTRDVLRRIKPTCELEDYIIGDRTDFQDGIEEYVFYELIEDLKLLEQEIVIKRLIEKYTFEELGVMFNMPKSTASSTYYRSLGKLRKKFKKLEKNA